MQPDEKAGHTVRWGRADFAPMEFDLDHMTDGMKQAQRERRAEFDRRARRWRWKWRIIDGVLITGIVMAFVWFVVSVAALWAIGHPEWFK